VTPFAAIAAALLVLALLDGTLCGFRAAAGRSGLTRKRAYYARAMRRAFLTVAATELVFVTIAGALWLASGDRDALVADFAAAGRAALFVYGPYATLVLAALTLWAIPALDVRTLATVTILGPFTMIRPLVVAAGTIAAVWARPRAEVMVLACVVALAMGGLERWLARAYRVDPALYS
jgi:hypothetical protein